MSQVTHCYLVIKVRGAPCPQQLGTWDTTNSTDERDDFPLPIRRSASTQAFSLLQVRQNIVDPRQVTLALRPQPLQHLRIKPYAHWHFLLYLAQAHHPANCSGVSFGTSE